MALSMRLSSASAMISLRVIYVHMTVQTSSWNRLPPPILRGGSPKILPLIERKLNALDQAAPMADWELPVAFDILRRLMESRHGKLGKREYVQVLQLMGCFTQDDVHHAVKQALELNAVSGACPGQQLSCVIRGRHQADCSLPGREAASAAQPCGFSLSATRHCWGDPRR
jgi:hypothetical protein